MERVLVVFFNSVFSGSKESGVLLAPLLYGSVFGDPSKGRGGLSGYSEQADEDTLCFQCTETILGASGEQHTYVPDLQEPRRQHRMLPQSKRLHGGVTSMSSLA